MIVVKLWSRYFTEGENRITNGPTVTFSTTTDFLAFEKAMSFFVMDRKEATDIGWKNLGWHDTFEAKEADDV